jgi:hypothetical protein
MTDRTQDPMPPDARNREQDDEDAQAQTVTDEALDRATAPFGLSDTEKVSGGIDDADAQDLVDHMRQMDSSGIIDMSAFQGERNDDDEDETYGSATEEE